MNIFEGRGHYSERGRFRSWLYTIATRKAMDRIRNHARRAELLLQHGDLDRPWCDPLKQAADRQLLERIEAVLHTLPPETVAAFHLRIRDEFRYAEIAAISGDSEGTLRSRIHHALKKIHRELSDVTSPVAPALRPLE